MLHLLILRPDATMVVGNVLADKRNSIISTVETNPTVKIAGKSRKPFKPPVKSRFVLGTRRHSHLYSPDGVEGLGYAGYCNLPAESVVKTLGELSPEL